MSSEASAQQPDATAGASLPTGRPGRRRTGAGTRRGLRHAAYGLFVGAWAALGAWHLTKPLPPGMDVAAPETAVPADSLRLLVDLTSADAYGQPVVQQQIFDETLQVIANARRVIVLDQFLFNDLRGAIGDGPPVEDSAAPTQPGERSRAPLRPLSHELADALIAARRARPALRILFITDPINDVYGGDPSPELARLDAAGIEVVRTDLDLLRDSNPLWSGFWRLTLRWWNGDARGDGWLPNPLETGPSRVTFRAWARLLNFKANHRKVVIADDGLEPAGLVGIVGSANPHDASSAHSNLALELRGEALQPLLQSEIEVARFSGWRGEALPGQGGFWAAANPGADTGAPARSVKGKAAPAAAARAGAGAGELLRVRVLTEAAIRDTLLERLAATRAGDRIDVAMFYLSARDVIEALLGAARRGASVRLLLDPNKDAFGRQKGGIPNRPVASELVLRSDGAIHVRWYRTHGEQFHTKMVAVHGRDTTWVTLGSANLTRRNLDGFNLEANLAFEAPTSAALAKQLDRYFETLWNNRAPTGIEYTADFGSFADPAQSSYWAYRILEGSGLSTF